MIKFELIQNYLFYITFLPEILPLVFCLFFFKKLNTKGLKAFFLYTILLAFFVTLTIIVLKVYVDKNSYFLLFRLFNICEFTTISLFLYHNLKGNTLRKLIIFNIFLFVVYASVDYFINDKTKFNNHSTIVSSLILITYIVYFFYEKMKTVIMYPLYQTISFWICVAFFLYFSGTFFFFLLSQSSLDPDFKNQMKLIYGLVTLSKNIILSLSLFANEQDENMVEEKLHIPDNINLDEISLTNFKNS